MPVRLRGGIIAPHDPSGSFLAACREPAHLCRVIPPASYWLAGSACPASRPGPWLALWPGVPANRPMPGRPLHVALRRAVESLVVFPRQLADNTARYARVKDSGRDGRAGPDDRAGRDQGPGTDPGAAEHHRADPDQGPGFHVCAVHGRVMPDSDPLLEDNGLTRVHVYAAQVLDVALCADHYFVLIRPEHGSVPDARERPDAHSADDYCSGRDPGVLVDRGNGVAKRADHGRCAHLSRLLALI